MFFGRLEELNEIKYSLSKTNFEGVLIYGRRRVGKTELINEAIQGYKHPIIRYECKKTTNYQNLVLLSKEVLASFDDLLSDYVFNNYDELFEYVFKKSCEKEFVFIIDEFSFLLQSDDAIDSSLAIAIDKYKNKSKLKLIISGSYVQILKEMISANAHLYGRFTHIISLKPMDYLTASMFYPNYSNEDKVKMYSVFGGIPYFNSLIDNSLSAEENIINLIVRKDSILEHEINEVILNETNKISEMNLIIETIVKGATKYSDILSLLSKDKIRIEYYLSRLIEMEVIEKKSPINDKNNKKKTFYVFKDNLMKFYYRYIFQNYNMRNVMNPNDFYHIKIKSDFESIYMPKVFENISEQYLILVNKKGLIDPIFYDIGTYYFDAKNKRNIQLDIVTEDEKGFISYECKYTNEPVNNKVIIEEKQQTIDLGMNIYKLGFISKNGFAENVDRNLYNCVCLEDMYKLEIL